MGWTGVIIPEEYGGSDFGYLTPRPGARRDRPHADRLAADVHRADRDQRAAARRHATRRRKTYLPKIAEGEADRHAGRRRRPAPRAGEGRADGEEVRRRLQAQRQEDLRARRHGRRSLHRLGPHLRQARRQGRHHPLPRRRPTPRASDAQDAEDGRQPRRRRTSPSTTSRSAPMPCSARSTRAADSWRRCSTAPAPASPPRCSARRCSRSTITLDYLKTRVQFGQVIGTFQALQHRAAKMFTDLELARSCVEARTAGDRPRRQRRAAAASRWPRPRSATLVHLVSNEMVQMHGGIGMTDAHDAGLYLKRARAARKRPSAAVLPPRPLRPDATATSR